jgi:hypothetical protein
MAKKRREPEPEPEPAAEPADGAAAPAPASSAGPDDEWIRQQWSPLGWEGNVGSPTPDEQKMFRREWRAWSRGRGGLAVGLGRLRPRRPNPVLEPKPGDDRP